MIKKIAVIGAGTMGNGIAHAFAQNDFKVCLIDINQDQLNKAIETIELNLNRLLNKGKISEEAVENCLNNISTSTDLKNGVTDADLVIEAVSESKELKKKIFAQLSKYCSRDCILASNTSSISITEIASATAHPEKVIGIHFMNPVPIMPLVEIIKAKETDLQTIEIALLICEQLDKTAVLANDFPGFVANRILMPMINEAILALEDGVAGVKEIDDIMVLGMSHPMGPLLLADYIGLDVCYSILEVLTDGFGNKKYSPASLLKKLVSEGKLGKKTGNGFYTYPNRNGVPPTANKFN